MLAYSPLEQGILTGKYSASHRPTGKRAETPWFSDANLDAAGPVIGALRRIAENRDVDIGAVALAWLLAKPDVIPLAGAKTAEQAARNAAALSIALEESEIEELDRLTNDWRVAE